VALSEQPRTFPERLHWFLARFAEETPERLHDRGVWFGKPARERDDVAGYRPATKDQDEQLVSSAATLSGGSILGSPRQDETVRQILEESPYLAVRDERGERYYPRPLRAALARLSARQVGDAPFMARLLAQVAYAQGDWPSVSARWFPLLDYEARAAYVDAALRRLLECFYSAPRERSASWTELSDSQRAAEEAGATMAFVRGQHNGCCGQPLAVERRSA
jgi:hypothetical protein